MPANKNWARWIFASVSRHFTDELSSAGIPLFIEGQHRDTSTLKDFVELRMDGPRSKEVSAGCWHLRVEINLLVQSSMDDVNYHRIHQTCGVVASAMKNNILVYRYGNTDIEDDSSFLGCLQLLIDQRGRDTIEINHFGMIHQETEIVQASVEAHYKLILEV